MDFLCKHKKLNNKKFEVDSSVVGFYYLPFLQHTNQLNSTSLKPVMSSVNARVQTLLRISSAANSRVLHRSVGAFGRFKSSESHDHHVTEKNHSLDPQADNARKARKYISDRTTAADSKLTGF
jgi:hypothetical protein